MRNTVVLICLTLLGITCFGILINDNQEVNKVSFKMCESYAELDHIIMILPSKDIIIDGEQVSYEELEKSCKSKK